MIDTNQTQKHEKYELETKTNSTKKNSDNYSLETIDSIKRNTYFIPKESNYTVDQVDQEPVSNNNRTHSYFKNFCITVSRELDRNRYKQHCIKFGLVLCLLVINSKLLLNFINKIFYLDYISFSSYILITALINTQKAASFILSVACFSMLCICKFFEFFANV